MVLPHHLTLAVPYRMRLLTPDYFLAPEWEREKLTNYFLAKAQVRDLRRRYL